MDIIAQRALARRAALQAELRAKYPHLSPNPPAQPIVTLPVDRTAIALGRDERGRAIMLPERPRLEHMHVIGTTGGGKSKFIGHCFRQDVIHGRGALILDPHGEHPDSLYRENLAWLETSGYARKRVVHIIDPNAASHTVGFNPLALPDSDTDLSVVSGLALEALSKAWGGEDTSTKPTIERMATTAFAVLADLGLTLVEAPILLDRLDRHGLRAYALEHVRDRFARDELLRLHELSLDARRAHDFDIEVVGPINRLARFLRPAAIRAMIGQTERLLDFQRVFDEGHIVLCNLSGSSRVYERDADLLGRLLTRLLFFHAKRRAHPERPFFVYLDECHRYLSGDLENILAESRKYGVGAVLAHQWLEQAAVQGDNMLAAIRNATNVKVVFRLKDPEEAQDLAQTVIPLDLEMPVKILTRPTVVGHRRTWLTNESRATNTGRTTTHGSSIADTEALGETIGESVGRSSSDGYSEGYTSSESTSEGATSGTSFGENAGQGSSTMAVDSNGYSMSMGIVTMPTDPMQLLPQMPPILSENYGTGYSASESLGSGASSMRGTSSAISEGKSRMKGYATATSSGHSRSETQSSSVSRAESAVRARSLAQSVSEGETSGKSESRGSSEALEPILEDRPSSVHSKENVLYMAAQTLRNLPTGHAVLNYVGRQGMVTSLLAVPPLKDLPITNDAFKALRERFLSQSAAAIPAALARALVDERERAFLAFTHQKETDESEPGSFRVAARSVAARRGDAKLVAASRALSGRDASHAQVIDNAPVTDGRQEQATPSSGQGSRSPAATAQSAALDGAPGRPMKARHAVNGATRTPSKV